MFSVAGLLAFAAFAAQSSAQQLPSCVSLCLGVKYQQASALAPNCPMAEISCFCSTTNFVGAYQQCLSDNCQDGGDAGNAFFDQICSQAGVGLSTYQAVTDSAASQSAAYEVASLLGMQISMAPVATDSAEIASASAAAAIARISGAYSQASASLSAEEAALQTTIAAVQAQAAAVTSDLANQYSGDMLSSIDVLVAESVAAIEAAASSQYAADASAASASLLSFARDIAPSGYKVDAASGASILTTSAFCATSIALSVLYFTL